MLNGEEKISYQSGVLPIAGDMIVLVTGRRSGKWIIPKGYVEKGMSPAESAAKEAWEEAGVTGKVLEKDIGTYRFSRPSGVFAVQVFPLEVLEIRDEWQEMHVRRRTVVTPLEAVRLISHEGLRRLVAEYFALRLEY
ncbi:MAG: NUDIX hydrolase [Chlorobiaceae bacterium]|nr:NUDIX hydrolase [Chlorobiaceae bacterium]